VAESLASKLMDAPSVRSFFAARGGRLNRRSFASLKREVDRLVHSDLNLASSLTERIEKLAVLAHEPSARPFALACRARVLHLLGRHRDANALYHEAIRGLRALKLNTEAAIVQKQEVDALTHAGRFGDALESARQARRVLAGDQPVHLAQLETNVGNIYYMLDRYRRALDYYDRAREVLEASGDAKMRALVDLNRANVFTELDQPDEAMAVLASAARALERAGQAVLAAQARSHLAYLQFLRGNYNTGLAGYYETRDRLIALGSIHLVAWCDLEIAEILLALNAFDDAAQNAETARARFAELGMPYEAAKSQTVAALAALGLGQLSDARRQLMGARRAFARDRNITFTATADAYLAEVELQQGRTRQAFQRARSASLVFIRQRLITKAAHSRLLAARAAYLQGDRSTASRLARSAMRSVENRYAPSVVYRCHHLIGKLERDAGRHQSALHSFLRAVTTVEKMRGGIAADEFKATFLGGKIEVFEDAIDACLDEGSNKMLDEAFRLVESSKSRSLADLLDRYLRETAVRKPGRTKGKDRDEMRERLRRLIADLNWYSSHATLEDEKGGQRRAAVAERYSREITRCERQITQLFRRIEAKGSSPDEYGRVREAGVDELRATLQADEAAVEYFTTEDKISAFVVSRERVTVVRAIASRREVEQTLAALRFQIEKFNYGSRYADEYFEQLNAAANHCLSRLYVDLFARLEREIGGRRLIVIPHGALHYVPFHALVNRRGYLVDQYEISYAPSATVLKLCRARSSGTPPCDNLAAALSSRVAPSSLSAASTEYEKSRAPGAATRAGRSSTGKLVALGVAQDDLPNIADEIRSLASLFPDAITLTGARATRSNLMREAPRARFLHLASHGYFRRDNPMFSFLKLADSQLNFYSLLDLKLNAELVTLSACHTGVNKVFPGDELHGLMRGFLHAGAPSLVASLWATSDVSTAALMKEMYSRIRAGEPKRAALREAQLAVKDDYGHPYYWAPFILMGNPN